MKYLSVVVLLLFCTREAETVIPNPVVPGPVYGVVGDDLILPCYLKDNVSAVDMEVAWLIGNRVVHEYKRHQDITDNQMPEYRHRTRLFRDELQRGNVSLNLTSVRVSDTNTYRCFVAGQYGTGEDTLKVQVNEFGNHPEISDESHLNGSATLTCVTRNWASNTPQQPVIEWLDSMGNILKHLQDSEYWLSNGTTFYVQQRITVQENANNSYTCRVSYLNNKKQELYEVPRKLFAKNRNWWMSLLPVTVLVVSIIVLYKRFRMYSKLKVLKQYRKKHIPKFVNVDRYTEPRIVYGHRKWGSGEAIQKKKDYQETSVENLLRYDAQCLVILQGESGYGKSSTAEKILHDWWLKKKYLKRYDLVFLLKVDELSLLSSRNLLDLVSRNPKYKYKNMIGEIMDGSPHKILFVIDGFDELSLSEEDSKGSPIDPFTPALTKTIVCGLLSGHILAQASLLVTTRPSASATVENLCRSRTWKFAEILGFTEESMKNYCKMCFGDNTALFESLKEKPMQFSSCFNPMLCWIICEGIKNETQSFNNIVELGTTTSMYLVFFAKFLQHLSPDERQNILQQAKKIMEEDNVQLDLTNIPPQEGDPFRRTDQQRPFIHQSFLEFFASVSYTVLDDEEAQRQGEELLISANRVFLPQSPYSSHIPIVLKFLFGLSNEDIRRSLQNILELPDGHGLPSLLPQLKQWILDRSRSSPDGQTCLLLLQCLYEFHDEKFVKEAMDIMQTISLCYTPLTRTDCCVLQYCLKEHPSIKQLDLRHCNLTSEELKLLEPVWNTLQWDDLKLTAKALKSTDIDELMKRIIPSPSEQIDQTHVGTKKFIHLQFFESDLAEETVPGLLKTFQIRNISSYVSIEVDKDKAGDGVYLSFSAKSGGDVFQLTVEFRKQEPSEGQEADPEVLSISLALPASQASSTDWAHLLQVVHDLRRDRSVVQHLSSLPDLQELEIQVTHLTVDWASDILCRIHSCPSLKKVKIHVGDRNTQDNSAFSSVTLERDDERMRIRSFLRGLMHDKRSVHHAIMSHTATEPDVRILRQYTRTKDELFSRFDRDASTTESNQGDGNTMHRLLVKDSSDELAASLTLPTKEVSSHEQCKDLLNMILELKEEGDQDECVKALLSKHVGKAKLRVSCMPVSLAKTVLSFFNNASKMNVSIWTKNYRDEDNLCSQLEVKKDFFNLSVRDGKLGSFNLSVRDGKLSSSSYTAPFLSGITLTSEQTPVNMDWNLFFTSFHTLGTLRMSHPDVDVHVGHLLSCLHGQHGLQEVDLLVSCLSDGLTHSIEALKKDCPSSPKVRVLCGRNIQFGDTIKWIGEGKPEDGKFGWTQKF
ncbi:hypothetical protein ACEWY4_022742 [Coilia grayii]|uniref:Uncharacterized protein n=1 Tax=Coilia grayii TaxID=363190 RepID=A0ABD1J1Z7_9TELE